jgi:hypothetical protein
MAVNNTTTGNGGGFINPAKPTAKPDPQGKAQDSKAVDANKPVQQNNKISNPQQVGNASNANNKGNNRPADNANQFAQVQAPQQPKTDTFTFFGGPFSLQSPSNSNSNIGFSNPGNPAQFAQQPAAQQSTSEPISVFSLLTPDQRRVLDPGLNGGNAASAKPEAAVQAATQTPAKPAAEPKKKFDAKFYLEQNPDVAAAVKRGDITPAEHFQKFGQAEGRLAFEGAQPFDAKFYLKQNPDVAAAVKRGDITAIEHFRKFGKAEGRSPNAEVAASVKSDAEKPKFTKAELQLLATSDNDDLKKYILAQAKNNNPNLEFNPKTGLTAGEQAFAASTDNDGIRNFILAKGAQRKKEATQNPSEPNNGDAPPVQFGGLPPGLAALFPPSPGDVLSMLLGVIPPENAGEQVNNPLMSLLDPLGLFSGVPATNPKREPAKAAPEAQLFAQDPVLQAALKGFATPANNSTSLSAFLSGKVPAAGAPAQKATAKAQVNQAFQPGGFQNLTKRSGNFAFGISGQEFLPSANPNTILTNVARRQENSQVINDATRAQVQRALTLSSINPMDAQQAASTLALLG